MVTPLMLAAVVVATSIAAALVALLLLSSWPNAGRRKPALARVDGSLEQAVFLFDDKDLVDATGTARELLGAIPGPGSEWARLSGYLSQRLRGFDAEMRSLAERGELALRDASGDLRVRAEWLGQLARLTVTDLSAEGQGVLVDALSHKAQESELAALRDTLAAAPVLIWRTDDQGDVVWANHAYLDAVAEQRDDGEDTLTWPVPALFPLAGVAGDTPRRQVLAPIGERAALWFDCHSQRLPNGIVHYALPADAAVKAEGSLREFVQTLSKTFAHLPIGLAIFDRQRQLALFNPALVDLTGAEVEFLSARPTLHAFLDRLRERQVIPEPKDYASWRQQMMDLEKQASRGLYEDTWTLPSGQTYHVVGRPHPDGAVAFLLEDITAEITLTRRFRSEIELGQAVVDTVEEAIVVFSPAGELILSNSAYDTLWGVEPALTLGKVTVVDSIRRWQEVSKPDPAFGDIRDFVLAMEERAAWTADLRLLGGDVLVCRVVPLPGGATLVAFARPPVARPPLRRGRRIRRGDHMVRGAAVV
ncbi:MAG: PAS-domain containing protein [Rhodobacteraceae bacterium]|nr:PAS-domain containing protein [uncultured Defluviimonas sp.]MCB2126633.1 PAS-domain containing protein [Paracoccaceae bacterium]MCC0070854.1 PAS-domain containing protein [Paracoccaceae bacterium]